jgi:hypothetical protein
MQPAGIWLIPPGAPRFPKLQRVRGRIVSKLLRSPRYQRPRNYGATAIVVTLLVMPLGGRRG